MAKANRLYVVQIGKQDSPTAFPSTFTRASVVRDMVNSMVKAGVSRSKIHVYKAVKIDLFGRRE